MTLSESKAEVCTAARVLAAAHLTGIDVGKAELVFWRAIDRYMRLHVQLTPRLLRAVPSDELVEEASGLLLSVESMHRDLAAELLHGGEDGT